MSACRPSSLGRDLRDPTPSRRSLSLAPQVVHRVRSERLTCADSPSRACPLDAGRSRLAFGDEVTTVEDLGAVDLDALALGERHDVGPEVVDQRDAGLDDDLRSEVRVAA